MRVFFTYRSDIVMKINEIKNGFKLLSTTEVKDVGSILHEYVHVGSGAKLVYLENDDTNCVFGIGFRTIPEDSTGVCHIIEHSLLCGSDKYPLKEPFINLVKGSLNTFLNAMTAADWTVYPVASQNQKDFSNLMAVYCDAVFAPVSMKDNKPFLQEGWHLELKSKEDIHSYKGVVYNEMKGAMSGVNRILNQATNEAMYPDTCYHYNSGGEPSVIPELTYEAYKDFYKRHYAPQNSLTFLYGKLDIDEKLKFLNEQYLSKYKKNDKEIEISLQKPLINKDYVVEYPLGKQEKIKDNTYFSLCYSLGVYGDRKEFIALQVLQDALLSTNISPLKKALLDAKLGQNVEAFIDDDCIQPSLHINLQKSNLNHKDDFEKEVIKAVKELAKNGIDKNTLLASINSLEFSMKEMEMGEAPKGLGVLFGMLSDFVYRKPFVTSLTFTSYFAELRKDINNGYFEKLLEKYILNSDHYVLTTAIPSKTIEDKVAKEMDKKMKEIKAKMSEEEIDELVKQTESLYAYQNREDSKEELATLPTLSMEDIPLTINYLDSKKTKIKGMKAITHSLTTNKIGYVNLYFNKKVLT